MKNINFNEAELFMLQDVLINRREKILKSSDDIHKAVYKSVWEKVEEALGGNDYA